MKQSRLYSTAIYCRLSLVDGNDVGQIARKYINFDELTPEIINNLISLITVSHVKIINGTKFREIKIIYKFIG